MGKMSDDFAYAHGKRFGTRHRCCGVALFIVGIDNKQGNQAIFIKKDWSLAFEKVVYSADRRGDSLAPMLCQRPKSTAYLYQNHSYLCN